MQFNELYYILLKIIKKVKINFYKINKEKKKEVHKYAYIYKYIRLYREFSRKNKAHWLFKDITPQQVYIKTN